MSATLLNIYLRPSSGTPARPAEGARVELGSGLAEDHATAGKREVTVLTREGWEAACAELGVELDPALRRANLLVEGVELKRTRGQQLRIGGVLLLIEGETAPCQLMEDTHPGLLKALAPDWRAGVFGRVLEAGELRPGDAVELLVIEDPPAA